jgi:hypothetical protein
MKTKLFFAILLAFFLNVATKAELGYVITNNDTIICDHVSLGVNNARITKTNGELLKINKEEVKAFLVHGKLYEKLPVYLNGSYTGQTAFLELIGQRNGLKLYKYTYFVDSGWDSSNQVVMPTKEVTALIIYKDNNYYLEVDDKNAKTVLPFFHITGA